MSAPIQTALPDTEIWGAFETMIKLGVRRLPIVQDGKLIGIVTEKDLTRWVLRVFYERNLSEEIRSLIQRPKSPRESICVDQGGRQYVWVPPAVTPPSIDSTVPVTNEASSDAR